MLSADYKLMDENFPENTVTNDLFEQADIANETISSEMFVLPQVSLDTVEQAQNRVTDPDPV